MESIKVFNNNAVSTIMPDGQEAIVIGNGIGFQKRSGDIIDETRIEKIYYIQNEMQTKFLQMLQDVQPEIMEAAEQIRAIADESGFTLSNQGTISLIDHISFAIDRIKNNLCLPNLMLPETRILYHKEFEIGIRALDIIEQYCKIRLPEDEAGYIALHLVSISIDRNAAYDILKFVKGALDIIRETYDLLLPESNIDTIRLTTHLKFLAQRILYQECLEDDAIAPMYDYLVSHHPKNPIFLERIQSYVQNTFDYALNQQELVYLLVHLTKIL